VEWSWSRVYVHISAITVDVRSRGRTPSRIGSPYRYLDTSTSIILSPLEHTLVPGVCFTIKLQHIPPNSVGAKTSKPPSCHIPPSRHHVFIGQPNAQGARAGFCPPKIPPPAFSTRCPPETTVGDVDIGAGFDVRLAFSLTRSAPARIALISLIILILIQQPRSRGVSIFPISAQPAGSQWEPPSPALRAADGRGPAVVAAHRYRREHLGRNRRGGGKVTECQLADQDNTNGAPQLRECAMRQALSGVGSITPDGRREGAQGESEPLLYSPEERGGDRPVLNEF
jgi:hypothetical protein